MSISMGTIEVTVGGRGHHAQRARDELGRLTGEIKEGAAEGCEALADDVAHAAETILASSPHNFSIGVFATGGGTDWEVVADGEFAEMEEYGAPGHTIVAHGRYPLKNEEEGFGPVWGPVNHPGVEAHPYMEPAVDMAIPMADGIVARYLP